MITKRIIPCLDIDKGRVVKGTNFINITDAGDPIALATAYADSGADELVFLDITASSDKRVLLMDLVRDIAKAIYIPFTVGGGINNLDMIQAILNLGADKVSLNTAALHNPTLIQDAARHFGSQCIVLAVDVKRCPNGPSGVTPPPALSHLAATTHTLATVYSHGGRTDLGIDALQWIQYAEKLGAGEILLTSMDRDGTRDGYDIDLLTRVKNTVSLPVIASGGAGRLSHITDVLHHVDAALLASLLHFGHLTIPDIKTALTQVALPVRPFPTS